jgi:tryptophanyl-tRNA synthetase
VIRKKIMRATTDSAPGVDFVVLSPGVENLLSIHQAFTGWSNQQMRAHFAGMRYGDLKKQVAEATVAGLEPLQQRYQEIVSDSGYVERILREGAARVEPIARATVELVKQRMGLFTAS